jgi:MoaA/NifB/PqqE/SkfB family radical SAM enzyme
VAAETWIRRLRSRYQEYASVEPQLKKPRAYWNWVVANLSMKARTGRLRARPLKLTFDPTNICQLRCPLCPTGLRIQDRGSSYAALHLFEHLMEELGDYLFFVDFYNWGEPLLNRHLEEMLRAAAAKRIVTSVSTNLSLELSDERLESLLTSGVSELIVSIDGASQETYGQYRRAGNWELAFGNLRRIMALKRRRGLLRPSVIWRYYVFRFNEHEIDRARSMAQEIGVDRLVFGSPFLDASRFASEQGTPESIRSWASTLPEYNRYQPNHPEYEDPTAPLAKHARCDWHYMSSAVNPDGGVSPCCAVFGKGDDFGSLEAPRTSYMELVNNTQFRTIRDRFAGRRAESTGLVCERCPTPSLMDYGRIVNRQIMLLTAAGTIEGIRRRFSRGGRLALPAPAGPPR